MGTRWREFLAGTILAGASLDALAGPALAAPALGEATTTAVFAFGFGALAFAGAAGCLHASGRRAARRREAELEAEAATLRARLHEAGFFLGEKSQALVILPGPGEAARVCGDLSVLGSEAARTRPLDFAGWLAEDDAARLAERTRRLRAGGEGFRLTTATRDGRWIEVEGAPRSGRVLLRLRDVSQDRLDAIGVERVAAEARAQLKSLWTTLEASPNPAWLRDAGGALILVNAAYASAVEAKDPADAVARGLELFDKPAREASLAARAAGEVWRARV
ncbi:hypothetical protein [Methylocella sp.]|uniref:hypothetical protein n=1 Tax=Methylocella sp. TaxID=1978226 RepID=UPI003782D6A9